MKKNDETIGILAEHAIDWIDSMILADEEGPSQAVGQLKTNEGSYCAIGLGLKVIDAPGTRSFERLTGLWDCGPIYTLNDGDRRSFGQIADTLIGNPRKYFRGPVADIISDYYHG